MPTFHENIGLVYSCVARMGVARSHRDDAQQEGMIALLSAIRTFDPAKGVAFSTYATRVVRNAVLMWIRTERNAGRRVANLAAATTEAMLSEHPPEIPEDSGVGKAMASLSERDRTIIILRTIEGLTINETAKQVGMSISGCQKAEMNAREVLKKALS